MSWRSFGTVLALQLVAIVVLSHRAMPAHAADARVEFFRALRALCGARYEGAMTFPTEGRDDFEGKRLVATVAECDGRSVRVPFWVGDDRSRTWVFTRRGSTLELKHDHRHSDGSPDSITMYGGMASRTGTPHRQAFPADAHTAALIPPAATNVWTIRLSEDGDTLVYHLERDARPRFTAVLVRVASPER